jgi:AI-2 transport protein TqsA
MAVRLAENGIVEQGKMTIPTFVRGSLAVLAFAAVSGLLYYGRWVLIPFVFAMFIFSLFMPVLDWLVLRLRFPRLLAVASCSLLVLMILAGFFFGLFEAMVRAIETIGAYSDEWIRATEDMFAYLQSRGIQVSYSRLLNDLRARIPGIASTALTITWSLISGLVLTVIFVFFLLASRDSRVAHKGVYAAVDTHIRRYLARKIALSAFIGVVVWAILQAFGLKLAMVFGFLAFLLDFIPTIGPTIATILPLPIALAQFQDSIWRAILIVAIIEVFELAMGYLVEPKVLGGGVDLHPVAVLLAISFWSLVWGIVGAFLAVPLTATIRIAMLRTTTFRPLGELLGGRVPEPPEGPARDA